jgi:hypothetical protein
VIRKSIRSIAILALEAVIMAGCGGPADPSAPAQALEAQHGVAASQPAADPIYGVKIYRTERDLPGIFEEWGQLGINTVFASEELASSGGFRALARKNDTDVFIIFPVFFAPEILAEDPDLWAVTAKGERAKDDWVEFVCPNRPEFRNRRVKEAQAIVKRLQPDGLSIDFIRYFVFWEMVGPDHDSAALPKTCYCIHCLQAFAAFLGLPSTSIPPQPQRAAAWIESNASDQWVRFRAATIASVVTEIVEGVRYVDPEIMINLHMVPWRKDDFDGARLRVAGQDPAVLSSRADLLSPMAYSFMLHRPPEWITSVIRDFDRAANCPILPSIQVSPAYREDEVFPIDEFEAALRAAIEPPSAGVVFWSWDHIEADSGRAEVIRRVLRDTTGEVGG